MCSCFLQLTLFREFRAVKAKCLDLELTTFRLCLFNRDRFSSCPRPLSNYTAKMASHIYDLYELMFMCVNEVNLLSFDFQFTIYDHKMYVNNRGADVQSALFPSTVSDCCFGLGDDRICIRLIVSVRVQRGCGSPAPVTTAKKKQTSEGEI